MGINWDITPSFFNSSFTIEVEYAGCKYDGIKYMGNRRNNFGDLGLDQEVKFQLMIKADDFSDGLPQVGELVSINGPEYRVLFIDKDSRDITVILYLGNKFGTS